jgi:hypothetical protein
MSVLVLTAVTMAERKRKISRLDVYLVCYHEDRLEANALLTNVTLSAYL